MKVGVFDSGVGGLSVVNAIKKSFPELELTYKEDKDNVPYGNKSIDELRSLVMPLLEQLVEDGCQVIVLACNTITTNLAPYIREQINVPIVGLEPMVKPAALQSKNKVIAVCATPATLKSERYAWLKQSYAEDIRVLEPNCSTWAYMIEANQLQHDKIADQTRQLCEQGADVIVLGCTHYHWIQEDIQAVASQYGAVVMQPEDAVVSRLSAVLEQLA